MFTSPFQSKTQLKKYQLIMLNAHSQQSNLRFSVHNAAAAAAQMSEQMLSNKLISRQKSWKALTRRASWGWTEPRLLQSLWTRSVRLHFTSTAAAITLWDKTGFNFKWCKSCKKTEKKKYTLCLRTLGLWAILARGSVHLFTRVSGIKSVAFERNCCFSSLEVFVHLIKAFYITRIFTQC